LGVGPDQQAAKGNFSCLKKRKVNMSKKMMLLALAAACAALFALPAGASAMENHLEPAEPFTITGPEGQLRAESEPTITCEKTDGSGKFDTGSTTTGTIELDFTGCHTTVFGITAKCRSEGSALDNTIKTSGAFHLITTVVVTENKEEHKLPDILVTPAPTKIVCAGISSVTVTGSIIGTITSPKCNESSATMGMSFSATGTVQDDMVYTGVKYDLKAYTGTSVENEKTAALVGTSTATAPKAEKLVCT
jgi:hypothetical protein